MTNQVAPKLEVQDAEDLGITSGMDDFDHLGVAAEAARVQRKRFVLACDATSSMNEWWQEAQVALKQAVDEIKTRTYTPFQIKVVAYRDHTCDPKPLEESDWSNNTDYLKGFISSIRSNGGGDFPESVGLGLAPAMQSGASLVVLIGDAPGRRESEGFTEAKALGSQGCPVYALYVDNDSRTVAAFEHIAALSGGKALHLKNAKSMTDIFSALLSKLVFQIEYQATSIEAKELLK